MTMMNEFLIEENKHKIKNHHRKFLNIEKDPKTFEMAKAQLIKLRRTL